MDIVIKHMSRYFIYSSFYKKQRFCNSVLCVLFLGGRTQAGGGGEKSARTGRGRGGSVSGTFPGGRAPGQHRAPCLHWHNATRLLPPAGRAARHRLSPLRPAHDRHQKERPRVQRPYSASGCQPGQLDIAGKTWKCRRIFHTNQV